MSISWEIFSDGSFDPKSKIGVGCYLLSGSGNTIQQKVFKDTTAARLELQAILWSLDELCLSRPELLNARPQIIIYTDSRTVEGLLGRRERLEATEFISKRKGVELNNADLYREFFAKYDSLNITVKWVRGHGPKEELNPTEAIFSTVDKFARNELRQILNDVQS